MLCDNDDDHYATLKQRQQYADKAKDSQKHFTIIYTGLTVVV